VEDVLSNIFNTKSSLEFQEISVMFEDGAIDDDLFSALG